MLINDADEEFRIGLIAPYRAQAFEENFEEIFVNFQSKFHSV